MRNRQQARHVALLLGDEQTDPTLARIAGLDELVAIGRRHLDDGQQRGPLVRVDQRPLVVPRHQAHFGDRLHGLTGLRRRAQRDREHDDQDATSHDVSVYLHGFDSY